MKKKIWNISIKVKIGIGFGFLLIVLIGIQYALNKGIANVIASQQELLKSTTLSTEIESIKSSVSFFESKMTGYVLTGNDTLLENNEKYLTDIVSKFKELKKLSPDKDQIASIDKLVLLLNNEIQFSEEVIFQYDLNPDNAVTLLKKGRGRYLMTEIIKEFDKIHGIEETKFEEIILRNKQARELVVRMDTSAYIFAFLLVSLCIWFLFRDINKREKLEKELVETKKRVEEASVIKEQFMANMSHEIRTPMNAIIGFNDRLIKTKLNEEQQEYVAAVQSSGENLLTIINDILDFSKIEAGMVTIEHIRFNLHELLQSVYNMFFLKAKEKNISLQLHQPKNIPECLMGDPTRLTQILINLVGNALKFTNQGNIDISVEVIKDDKQNATVQFKVKDTGIGILEEKIVEVFDRFTQAESDTSRIFGGTGLGLSIVKKLVELQSGTITVESKKEEGSLFKFTIPYKKAPVLVSTLKTSPEKIHTTVVNDKIKILIVEDNLLNQKLAAFMIKDFGYKFDICGNGKLAVDKLKQDIYDLVLMDIQMPEMDGYEATGVIRKKLMLNIPIIAMTAHAMQGEKDKCLGFGMTDYISKPIKENDLHNLIIKYI
ncbi:MAG: ATP-binding protein [Bacteroidota bacterium]|nr:ATP-binding protein [Bacteroidota bacterium]